MSLKDLVAKSELSQYIQSLPRLQRCSIYKTVGGARKSTADCCPCRDSRRYVGFHLQAGRMEGE